MTTLELVVELIKALVAHHLVLEFAEMMIHRSRNIAGASERGEKVIF